MFKRTHTFVSSKSDGADATLVRPGNWNAAHSIGQELTNRTGGGLVSGDVVALSAANDESVILADTLASQRTYVVAMDTIADTVAGLFAGSGYVWTIRVAGATTRGNWLVKSVTSKAVEDSGIAGTNPPPVGAVAVALGTSGGAGTIPAYITPTAVPAIFFKGSDIASASSITVPRGVTYAHITGTTGITAIASLPAGTEVLLEFDGVVTLTHNGASFILPGGVNYTTEAGELLRFVSEGSGNWRMVAPDHDVLTYVAAGTNPAQSGPYRMANAAALTARNAANSADKPLVQLDSSDQVTLSDGTQIIRPNGPVRCDLDNKGFVLPNTFA